MTCFLCIFLLVQYSGQAQPNPNWSNLKPVGYFLEDSISVGLPVHYSLSLRHASELELVFPAEKFDYAPFELQERIYFETKTNEKGSLDSVVYRLTTFEVDPLLTFSLPIYLILDQDCTAIRPNKDSLFLREMIQGRVEQQNPKAETDFQATPTYFDYPYLISFVLVLLIFFLLIWGIFGKGVLKAYGSFQLKTRQAVFLSEFSRVSQRIMQTQSVELVEKAITLWKKHLEYLEDQPYSTYTSKEIIKTLPDERLAKSLKNVDRAIYGQEFPEEIEEALRVLKDFAIRRFSLKQEALQND